MENFRRLKNSLKSSDRSQLIIIDLLTVCNINQASAKIACDDFVTCLAAPATAKKVAFSTQIPTELKAP